MNTLFLIIARAGSKGIPGKNSKFLGNKPLIKYSIDLAKKFVPYDYICVSTDSQEIADIAKGNGLTVPFLRPPELASDTAGAYEVILHAVNYYEKILHFDKVVLFQPTSPFRLRKHVEECIKAYETDCEMVVSVKLTKSNPFQLLFIENEEGYLEKVIKGNNAQRRQDLPQVYQLNGAVYVYNVEALKIKHPRDFTKIKYYKMPEENSVDLDEPLDWHWAEYLLEKNIVKLDYE